MNSICPGCGAVYHVTPQHVGRHVACKKCGADLLVQADGLHLAAAAEPSVEILEDEAGEAPPKPYRAAAWAGQTARFQAALGAFADIPTWLFGAGSFLVILFLFLPLIDQAKVAGRQAAVEAGDLRERRLERALLEKKERTAEDEDVRSKGREKWKKDKEALQEAVEEVRIGNQRSPYWYRWGMMFGFLFLAAAALGYLSPQQPTIRRVVGSIVILSEVVLIFIVFVFSSAVRL